MRTLLATVALLTAPATTFAHDLPGDGVRSGVLHATASASADVAPDLAKVRAGVQSEAPTAKEAMAANSAKMRRVFDALTEAGVARRDIATSYLNLSPRFDYDREGRKRINERYAVSNVVTVTTRDLDTVGTLIDSLLDAGLNNIDSVNFMVEDQKAAQDKARRDAIRNAREKAEDMAEAAGVTLGELLVLTEGAAPGRFQDEIVPTGARMGMAMEAAPPLSPGQRELTATVTLSYAID